MSPGDGVMSAEKRYLGDGVYASFDGYHVWIWTSDGIRESEKIALESTVLFALNTYDRDMRKQPIRIGDRP